jgi:hypothetical protein
MRVEPDRSRLWPLHPQPGEYETLRRWVERIAENYGLPPQGFCQHLFDNRCPSELDGEPFEQALDILSAGTGVPTETIREMQLPRVMDRTLKEYVRLLQETAANSSTNSPE